MEDDISTISFSRSRIDNDGVSPLPPVADAWEIDPGMLYSVLKASKKDQTSWIVRCFGVFEAMLAWLRSGRLELGCVRI